MIHSSPLRLREITAKSALSPSKISDYVLNPYTGCAHACAYCYVRLMQRFFHHAGDVWGSYVDVKINAARLLLRELPRKRRGTVMLSSVTDCYQPLEKKYRLTRACLELLGQARFPVEVLTKSSLILRDLDVLKKIDELEVGLTVATDREPVRMILEPGASSIPDRLETLRALRRAGLKPWVFVGPLLPMDPRALARALEPLASFVYIDRMNYPGLARSLLKKHGWDMVFDPGYQDLVIETFLNIFGPERVETICK